MRRFFGGLAILMWLVGPVSAQQSGPPPAILAAFEAVDAGDWDTAYALVAGEGAVARDLITWARLREGDAIFNDYPAFLVARPDWPGLDRVRSKAETLLEDVPADAVVRFFEGQEVTTGEGAVAYAAALIAEGRRGDAESMVERVWREQGLTESGFNALEAAYPGLLLPIHLERADMLLWRWRTEDATRLLPFLEEGQRALVRARIGYITKAGDIEERVALVPERLRNTPGLVYDRFNWLADRGDWTEAVTLLQTRDSAAKLGQPGRWGSWRRILARWKMREGDAETAYALASQHFLSPDDSSYPDLEWLSGYLALTYLNDPDLALRHFEAFHAAVSSPISLGRAGYWIGRTQAARGDQAAAQAGYRLGAQYQTSFYGLLAAEELGLALNPEIVGGEVFPAWEEADFLTNDKFQAGMMLLTAGKRGLAVLFFADLAKELDRTELGQLGQLLLEMDEPFYALLTAKAGVRRNLLVQDIYFPIHPLANMELPVEPALALAISRQESEFRTDAGSAVGALGLMQLMPGTARDMAQATGLPFSRGRLTSDWEYNATLGSHYLAQLVEQFGQSPVLIAVGYNAGPGRVRQWIDARGDPRRGADVVDWIEHIPFRETRNYVMRVTEGIPIYRARLSGKSGPVAFHDLLIGSPPIIRPQARPDGLGAKDPASRPVVRRGGEIGPAAPQGPQSIRPIARPGGN